MITVLYIDDEAVLLDIAKQFLERTGTITVETATSAQQALGLIGKKSYDAIVSDYQMPGMDGIAFLKVLREAGNEVPFIIFTGKGREEVVIQAFENGADFYIQKGGDPRSQFAELAHKVTRAVELRKSDAARRESDRRLEDIIDFLPDATFAIDLCGNVIAWNRAIEEMTGVNATEIVGTGDYAYAIPFYGERRPILIDLALEDKEEVRQRYSYVQWDGDRLVAETTGARLHGQDVVLWGTASSLYDAKGRLSGAIESIRDITALRRAEEALKVAQEKYEKAFQAAPDALLMSELGSGRFVEVNDAASLIFGYTRAEMIGKSALELGIWPDEAGRRAFVTELADHGHVRRYEVVEYRKSGDPFIASINADTMTISGIRYMISIVRDISEQKRVEQSLRVNEARFRAIVENASDMIRILDQDGRIVFDTDASTRTLGYPAGSTIGKDPFEYIHPDDLERVRADLRQVYERANPGTPTEFRVRKADGSYAWVEATGTNLIGVPGVDGVVTATRFIDERKKADAAIRVSEDKFRTLLENMPDLVLVHRDGIALYVNPALTWTLGYMPQEVVNTPLVTFVAPEYRDRVLAAIRDRAEQKPPELYEIEVLTKAGERRAVRVRGAMIEYGGEPAVLNVLTDITAQKRADRELSESEARYSALFDHNYSVSLLIDPDTALIMDANDAACRYYGYSRDQLLETGIYELNRLPREKVIADLARAKGEQEKHFFSTHYLAGGEKRYVEVYSGPITVQGRPLFYSIIHDITERKQTEAALSESEARLQAIIQGSPIPKFVIDREHRVISWNRALEQMTGIPAEEVLGTDLHWQVFYRQPRPCMADLVMNGKSAEVPAWYEGKFWEDGLIGSGYGATDFFPHLGTSGKWLRFVAAPIQDPDGTVIGAVETIEDITELKETERSLRESEQRYYNIIEDQTEFICRFKPDGTHVFVNEAYARYFGKKREDLIGKVFHPNVPPEDQAAVRKFFASLTPEHPVDYIQHRIIMPGGEVRWQRWSDRAIFAPDGTLTEYQSVGRDTTAQRLAEDALRIANTKLNLLSSITRHDINNQLLVLDGYLDLLHGEVQDPRLETHFTRIANASAGISSIIRFTKEYEQLGVNEPAWQDIRGLIEHAASLINKGPVTLTNLVPPGTKVKADQMLGKVFANLLDNSIRHGQTLTEVVVSVLESDEGMTLLWEDNGVGVPDDEKTRIFSPGYGKHTGLGLFLVQEILSINGISIRETGKNGKGARFEVRVPQGWYRLRRQGRK